MTDIIQSAMNAFVNGRIKEAERTCRAILRRQPSAHPALHLLAMTEKRRGKFKQAIRTFNKALRLAPTTAMYWNNLGETYREMGDPDRAIKSYQRAIKHRPEYAEAYSNWGAALMMKGDHLQAEQQLLRATTINPDLINAIYNLGVLYIDTDSPELARQAIERTLEIDPDNDDALVNLAYLDKKEEQFDQAQAHYLRALAINPFHFEAQLNLADLYFDKQLYAEAIDHFGKATEITPGDLSSWLGLGRAYMKNGCRQDACSAFKRATAIGKNSRVAMLGLAEATLMDGEPDDAMRILERYRKIFGEDLKLHGLLAKIYLEGGAPAKAEAHARSCLALDPESVPAYEVIVQAKRFQKQDDDLQNMVELYKHPGLTARQRASLAFSIARAMDMAGEYAAAFDYMEQGNRFRTEAADQGVYDLGKTRSSAKVLESVFTPEFMQMHNGDGYEDDAPIFIVGLPRSGKTVTETFLCRHPLVAAGGEISRFGDSVRTLLESEQLDAFPSGVAALKESGFESVGKEYVGELRRRFKRVRCVTNTLPANLFQLGMIHLCLPQAKVVWIDREIRDNCFEIYRKNFARWHEYSNDLGMLGEYAVLFNNLMDYWEQLLPGFIYKLKFEDLLAAPETQLRGLLDFCGLEWDDASLHEPRREQGETGVASMPTAENAIGVWKPYEKHLAPLFDALDKR